MLSTDKPLKCHEGKLNPPLFQYPMDDGPAMFEVDHLNQDFEFEHATTIGGYLFEKVLPWIMGIILLLFFTVSSSFVVYGIVRHVYTDHLLPRKSRTVRKLGKHPETKRRKIYRARKTNPSGSTGKTKPYSNIFAASAAAVKWHKNLKGSIDSGFASKAPSSTPRYMTFVKTEYNETPFYLESMSHQLLPSPVASTEKIENDGTLPAFTFMDLLDSPSFREILDQNKERPERESIIRLPEVHSSTFEIEEETMPIPGPRFEQVRRNNANGDKAPARYRRISDDPSPRPLINGSIFPKKAVPVHPIPQPPPEIMPKVDSPPVKRESNSHLVAKPQKVPVQAPYVQVKPEIAPNNLPVPAELDQDQLDLPDSKITETNSGIFRKHKGHNNEPAQNPTHKRTKKRNEIKFTSEFPRVNNQAPKVPLHVVPRRKHPHHAHYRKHHVQKSSTSLDRLLAQVEDVKEEEVEKPNLEKLGRLLDREKQIKKHFAKKKPKMPDVGKSPTTLSQHGSRGIHKSKPSSSKKKTKSKSFKKGKWNSR